MLVERDEVAHDAIVELERTLVLGQRLGIGVEVGDDVVAVFARSDGIRELAASPVVGLDLAVGVEQPVISGQLVVDGGVFECRVEDVHRLVYARHVSAILPLVVVRPPPVAECRGRDEGELIRPL